MNVLGTEARKIIYECLSHPIHKFCFFKHGQKCKIIQLSGHFDTGKSGPYPGLNIVSRLYRLNDW